MQTQPMGPHQLLQFDRGHIWHPYASMPDAGPVYPVASASGCTLHLADGRELIDGMSSWWAAIHGYNNPRLNGAITAQLSRMAHVMFGGLTHEAAVRLAQQLVRVTPQSLQTVFFCDSGSVAVEVAIKTAMQYWRSQGNQRRRKLVTVRNGYHGDTFGAMAVCDPVTGMHHLFSGVLARHFFAPRPPAGYDRPCREEDLAPLRSILEEHREEIAAMILEPIVQGAGGMRFYSPQYLREVRRLCDQFDVLLILDEIATGFGRTGFLFGCEHAGIEPDIMCVGKALTGGYMTLAAMLCRERVARTIHDGECPVLMHGPTFMANPLACAVALESIEELLEGPWLERVRRIEKMLREQLGPLSALPHVADVRVLGAIGVVELTRPVNMTRITEAFVARGVWLRPFGKLVYTMPPYVISEEELSRITEAIREVLQECRNPASFLFQDP